jgi:class 3 adenylate cyclase/YHS domain-containing protein/DNA-binding transcriptional MerR regulator
VTLDELAALAGEPSDDLRHWQQLGLLPSEGDTTTAEAFERVRLIRFALNRGYTAERLAEIARTHGDMIGTFAGDAASRTGGPMCAIEEAAADAGIDADVFQRLRNVMALRDQRQAYAEDVDAIRLLKTALDTGLDPDLLAQILRVFSDATTKMADGAIRLFHFYVHEQLRASGGGEGADLLRLTNLVSEQTIPLVEPAVIYLYRKAWERAMAEDMMLHLAEEATAPAEVPGEFTRAFLFVDLSSFTPMTEAMGDAAAARVVERFSELVRDGAAHCSGQVVKQIGDEFMLAFAHGRSAVTCGLMIRTTAAAEPRFPALRMGAHVGSVLYREGDYLGTAVNTAARVAGAATRHQFLVTDAVRRQLDDLDVDVIAVGPRSLKGLSEEVELFELRRGGAQSTKVVDPVCGMELDEESAEAQLHWDAMRLLFCSEPCLRRFLDNPDRYQTGPGRL